MQVTCCRFWDFRYDQGIRAAKLLSNATEVQHSGHNLYYRNGYEQDDIFHKTGSRSLCCLSMGIFCHGMGGSNDQLRLGDVVMAFCMRM